MLGCLRKNQAERIRGLIEEPDLGESRELADSALVEDLNDSPLHLDPTTPKLVGMIPEVTKTHDGRRTFRGFDIDRGLIRRQVSQI
jgi:hypothetical protein